MVRAVSTLLVPVQAALALAGLMTVAMWPPRAGDLLLVPLFDRDANAAVRIALAGGAALVGPGPLPGSIVVSGNRSRIARQMSGWGTVLMAAPPAGCGTAGEIARAR